MKTPDLLELLRILDAQQRARSDRQYIFDRVRVRRDPAGTIPMRRGADGVWVRAEVGR